MSAVQSANGYQTGLSVFPTMATVTSSGVRAIPFAAVGGILGNEGITWGLTAGAKGSISSAGVYTPPSSVSAPAVDQILATATDGSQAQALVSLIP